MIGELLDVTLVCEDCDVPHGRERELGGMIRSDWEYDQTDCANESCGRMIGEPIAPIMCPLLLLWEDG